MRYRIGLVLCGLLFTLSVMGEDSLPRIAPKSPQEALTTFRTMHGFTMELVAHEPQVVDPVAACYDENGRLFVVEMRDYPTPPQAKVAPRGRVRLLDDRDGDGRYEASSVFAEGFPWPSGIACWQGGVFVLSAPDIWYLKDTNGDGTADVRQKVFTGFTVYNVQALANNLRWGVDNHIHGITAGNGGAIRPADRPQAAPISVTGRDFRFDPRTNTFEPTSGTTQFGLAFDDWYERFLCANRLIAGHVMMPIQALERNPLARIPRTVQDCASEGENLPIDMFQISPPEAWREARTRRYHQEKQNLPPSEMNTTGVFTSGTGITIYRGDAYPVEYRGQMFIGNVAGNLVHRRKFMKLGASYRVTRIDPKQEFLASTDNWFRPVNFINAPDGTLHILDMYRETVEHPWSIPDDIKAQLDLESGADRGRIYRLAPPKYEYRVPPRMGALASRELVTMLSHANAWHRETAQRLLIERGDRTIAPQLREVAQKSPQPLGQLHALWTLAGLGMLEDADIRTALASPEPGLRIHGLRWAEQRVAADESWADAILKRANDSDAHVRYQCALSLGAVRDPAAIPKLAFIARQNEIDPWIEAAVLTACHDRAIDLLEYLDGQLPRLSIALITMIGSNPDDKTLARLTKWLRKQNSIDPLLIGLGDGLLRAGQTFRSIEDRAPGLRQAIDVLLTNTRRRASDERGTTTSRAAAIQILAHDGWLNIKPIITAALDLQQPREIQLAAIRAVRAHTDDDVAGVLIDRLASLTPSLRAEVLTTLVGRANWARALLEAIANGKVDATLIDTPRRAILRQSRDEAVKALAAKWLPDVTSQNRLAVIARYRAALQQPGEAKKGQAVFMRECAYCHVAGNIGNLVGPVMAAVGNRTPEGLLLSILDPNREVEPRYLSVSISTRDGRLLTGMLTSETATALTLRRANNINETVLRSEIEELVTTGQSLMPEGLEQRITIAEMADLLAFLAETR